MVLVSVDGEVVAAVPPSQEMAAQQFACRPSDSRCGGKSHWRRPPAWQPRSPTTARQAVQCKLGRCLIRLQECERLLKGLVLVSGAEQASEPHSVILGRLMGTFADIAPQDALACAHFRFERGPDALNATEKGLAELVAVRDELVHRFSERFDTDQVAGCTAAGAYLDECNAKVGGHLLTLRVWAAVIDEARASLPLFLDMPAAASNDIAKYLEKFRRGSAIFCWAA